MAVKLDDNVVAAYAEDGAVCLRNLLDQDWIERLRDGVEQAIAEPGPMARLNGPDGDKKRFFVDFCLWLRIPVFDDLVWRSPLAAAAAQLMASDKVNFYHEHLLVKEPGAEERTPWHHDMPYYPLTGDQICSFWIPLDDVPEETAVRYVRGSHRWGKRYQPMYFKKSTDLAVSDEVFEAPPDIDAAPDQYDLLHWELTPGDCIAFHGLTLHGGPGNPSATRRRRAFAARWTGDDVRYAERQGQVSPPIENHGVGDGEVLDSDTFPVVWRDGARRERQTVAEGDMA